MVKISVHGNKQIIPNQSTAATTGVSGVANQDDCCCKRGCAKCSLLPRWVEVDLTNFECLCGWIPDPVVLQAAAVGFSGGLGSAINVDYNGSNGTLTTPYETLCAWYTPTLSIPGYPAAFDAFNEPESGINIGCECLLGLSLSLVTSGDDVILTLVASIATKVEDTVDFCDDGESVQTQQIVWQKTWTQPNTGPLCVNNILNFDDDLELQSYSGDLICNGLKDITPHVSTVENDNNEVFIEPCGLCSCDTSTPISEIIVQLQGATLTTSSTNPLELGIAPGVWSPYVCVDWLNATYSLQPTTPGGCTFNYTQEYTDSAPYGIRIGPAPYVVGVNFFIDNNLTTTFSVSVTLTKVGNKLRVSGGASWSVSSQYISGGSSSLVRYISSIGSSYARKFPIPKVDPWAVDCQTQITGAYNLCGNTSIYGPPPCEAWGSPIFSINSVSY